MKKTTLLLSAALFFAVINANSQNTDEVSALISFLNSSTAQGGRTNADMLRIKDLSNPASWTGVVWENGNVKNINWRGYALSGNISLKNFTSLQNLDLSRNHITSVEIDGCSSLKTADLSRNNLTTLNLDGCTALTRLICYKNKIIAFFLDSTHIFCTLKESCEFLNL